MDKKFADRLKKLVPEGGGFDISFNLTNSGQAGKVASTLNLTIFEASKEGRGPTITKKVTIPAIAESVEAANKAALEDTLRLLGV
jgi:hypothetical protein